MFVVRIGAGLADPRISIFVREIENKMPAGPNDAPPLFESRSVILDMLKQVRGKNKVLTGVVNTVKLLARLNLHIRLHADTE